MKPTAEADGEHAAVHHTGAASVARNEADGRSRRRGVAGHVGWRAHVLPAMKPTAEAAGESARVTRHRCRETGPRNEAAGPSHRKADPTISNPFGACTANTHVTRSSLRLSDGKSGDAGPGASASDVGSPPDVSTDTASARAASATSVIQ